MIAFALSRSELLILRFQRAACACRRSDLSGRKSRARAGSSGLAQPSRQLKRSRNTAKSFCHPGGQALKSLPLESSMRGMRKWSS